MIRCRSIDGIFSRRGFGYQFVVRMVILLPLACMLLSCETKVSADLPPELLKNANMPSVEALNFETFYTDSGIVKYHLQTPKLLLFDEAKPRYKDFPDGFIFQRYDKNKKVISQLSGNKGKYYDDERKWEANGNVVLVNSKGDTLRSEELKYHEKEDLIFSEQFVSIKKGDQTLFGNGGFKSDTQMTKWSFIKTTGHIYVEGQ